MGHAGTLIFTYISCSIAVSYMASTDFIDSKGRVKLVAVSRTASHTVLPHYASYASYTLNF